MKSTNEMLVIDASYTYEMIVERGIEQSVLCRDLNGFFTHVWNVHPFATLLTSPQWTEKYGKPVIHEMNDSHTFIEGKVGRFNWLSKFFALNFFISQFLLFFKLLRLIKKNNIKVIRVGDPSYLGLFGLSLSFFTRVPLVIRINGNNERVRNDTGKPLYPKLFRSIKLESAIEKFVLPFADLVVSPNQDNLEYSLEYGAKPDRVKIFGYGNLLAPVHLEDPLARSCDQELFDRLGVLPNKFLLIVGRLQPIKFPDDAIRVLTKLHSENIKYKLVYVGEGEMLEELKALAISEGISDSVIFLGNQNQNTLAQLYTYAAVVVSPLTGRALSEAGLCGGAVVAYNLDWQGDIILNDKTGCLVPFREWENMANGAKRLIEDVSFSNEMRINLRKHAFSMLNPAELNKNEIESYRKLIIKQ